MNVNTSLDETKNYANKAKINVAKWSSIYIAQIPSPVAESALKYIFRALKITILPFTIPKRLQLGGENPFHTYPYPHT